MQGMEYGKDPLGRCPKGDIDKDVKPIKPKYVCPICGANLDPDNPYCENDKQYGQRVGVHGNQPDKPGKQNPNQNIIIAPNTKNIQLSSDKTVKEAIRTKELDKKLKPLKTKQDGKKVKGPIWWDDFQSGDFSINDKSMDGEEKYFDSENDDYKEMSEDDIAMMDSWKDLEGDD
jgi:hypothetical protein